MPIGELQLVGDFTSPGSFTHGYHGDKISHELLSNHKAVEKIRQIWEKVPFHFDFYVVNRSTSFQKPGELLSASSCSTIFSFEPSLDPETISVFFTQNVTNPSRFIPLTSWILGHRIHHALLFAHYNSKSPVLTEFSQIEIDLHNLLGRIARDVYGSGFCEVSKISINEPPLSNQIVTEIFTMRSARLKLLSNNLDFGPELMAQYLITGQIRFNSLPETLVGRLKDDMITADPDEKAIYDETLQHFAVSLPSRFDQLFEGLKGMVLRF